MSAYRQDRSPELFPGAKAVGTNGCAERMIPTFMERCQGVTYPGTDRPGVLVQV